MYNPYLPASWEDRDPPPPPPPPPRSFLEGLPKGILDRLKGLDTGDILLILLLLYLFWEDKEDHLELILTIGLLLIL